MLPDITFLINPRQQYETTEDWVEEQIENHKLFLLHGTREEDLDADTARELHERLEETRMACLEEEIYRRCRRVVRRERQRRIHLQEQLEATQRELKKTKEKLTKTEEVLARTQLDLEVEKGFNAALREGWTCRDCGSQDRN